MRVSVLTLNILHDHGDWPKRARGIGDWLDRLSPDLVALQEVLRGDGVDQLEELLGRRGYHTAYAEASRFWQNREHDFGNAIGSRWPIVDHEVARLPTARDGDGETETRCALAARIDSPFGPIELVCTHLNWRFDHGYVRERQVVALADFALRRAPADGLPPILAGDLNAEPDSAEIRYLTGLQSIDGRSVHFRDAWALAGDGRPGHTWSRENPLTRPWLEPDRRIDYVLVAPPRRNGVGRVLRCDRVADAPVSAADGSVWPSDHFGVYAELRATPDPSLPG